MENTRRRFILNNYVRSLWRAKRVIREWYASDTWLTSEWCASDARVIRELGWLYKGRSSANLQIRHHFNCNSDISSVLFNPPPPQPNNRLYIFPIKLEQATEPCKVFIDKRIIYFRRFLLSFFILHARHNFSFKTFCLYNDEYIS